MALASPCLIHCNSSGDHGMRLDISISQVRSPHSPTCCVAIREECEKLKEELDQLYKDCRVLQQQHDDLQRRVEEEQAKAEKGKETEKRLFQLQKAVSDFVSRGLTNCFLEWDKNRSDRLRQSPDDKDSSLTDGTESPADMNLTEKLMSDLVEFRKRVAILEEEKKVLQGLYKNSKDEEVGLSQDLSSETQSQDGEKHPQEYQSSDEVKSPQSLERKKFNKTPPAETLLEQCQGGCQQSNSEGSMRRSERKNNEVAAATLSQQCHGAQHRSDEDMATLEKMNKELVAENQQLQSSVEQAIMLAALWENRWRSCDEKRQRLKQYLQVLKQDQENADWDWRPWELNDGPDVRAASSRFQKEVCQMAECKNCRRFFEGDEAEGDLCQYHSQRPLSMTEWQSLFPGLNHDAIVPFQGFRFWPCCSALAKKTPPGCRVGQHVIKSFVNRQLEAEL